jgi:hypothetical protein
VATVAALRDALCSARDCQRPTLIEVDQQAWMDALQ